MPTELPFASSDDPLQILKKTRTWPGLDFVPDADALIDREMVRAADPTLFPLIAAALQIDDLTLDRLRQAAALLFLGADDFNSLHAVTALHAARVLSDFATDRRAFSREVWRALLALYLSLDRPEVPTPARAAELTTQDLPDWECDSAGRGGRQRRACDQARLLLPCGEPRWKRAVVSISGGTQGGTARRRGRCASF